MFPVVTTEMAAVGEAMPMGDFDHRGFQITLNQFGTHLFKPDVAQKGEWGEACAFLMADDKTDLLVNKLSVS